MNWDEVCYPEIIKPVPHSSFVDPIALARTIEQIGCDINRLGRHQSDLWDLVRFLDEHPGSSIKDWARYEAVKKQMQEAV